MCSSICSLLTSVKSNVRQFLFKNFGISLTDIHLILLLYFSQQVVRPSNHATIQSIVKAVGIIPGVPEPCCTPDKMNSLSVLFLDESRNVVLKIYPNMSVESCSCR